jgi:hypothetical protein
LNNRQVSEQKELCGTLMFFTLQTTLSGIEFQGVCIS